MKNAGKRCARKHSRAPPAAPLFNDEQATRAVLSFLRDTKVGPTVTILLRSPEEEEVEVDGGDEEAEEEEPPSILPENFLFPLPSPLYFLLSFPWFALLLSGLIGKREKV